jgi:hypothetical protein
MEEVSPLSPGIQKLGGPVPNWGSIFKARPDLSPPGYEEVFLYCSQNPRKTKKERAQEKSLEKKKSKSKRGKR